MSWIGQQAPARRAERTTAIIFLWSLEEFSEIIGEGLQQGIFIGLSDPGIFYGNNGILFFEFHTVLDTLLRYSEVVYGQQKTLSHLCNSLNSFGLNYFF